MKRKRIPKTLHAVSITVNGRTYPVPLPTVIHAGDLLEVAFDGSLIARLLVTPRTKTEGA